jgi:hypothetical protein
LLLILLILLLVLLLVTHFERQFVVVLGLEVIGIGEHRPS